MPTGVLRASKDKRSIIAGKSQTSRYGKVAIWGFSVKTSLAVNKSLLFHIQALSSNVSHLPFSLQGLGQDMFSFFRDLGVPSVFCIEGKLMNNYASDVFLAELSSLISSLCTDMKPKIYREASL